MGIPLDHALGAGLAQPSGLEVRPAKQADARAMAPLLRDSDRAEILAASGSNRYAERLERAVTVSRESWLVSGPEGALCLFGLAPTDIAAVGSPWLVGARAMDARGPVLARLGREAVRRFIRQFTVLVNWVDARNAHALRFASWLGFECFPAAPRGPLGRPFHLIVKRRQPCANPHPSSP